MATTAVLLDMFNNWLWKCLKKYFSESDKPFKRKFLVLFFPKFKCLLLIRNPKDGLHYRTWLTENVIEILKKILRND
jgi:hypothetical protein